MTRQQTAILHLQRQVTRYHCSSLVQKRLHSAFAFRNPLSWLLPSSLVRLFPRSTLKRTISSPLGTSNGQDSNILKSRSELVKFTHTRLAYPSNNLTDHGSPIDHIAGRDSKHGDTNFTMKTRLLSASKLLVDDFAISLPNVATTGNPDTTENYCAEYNEESRGGVAIVGRNGSGKTLLGKAIFEEAKISSAKRKDERSNRNPYVLSGSIHIGLADDNDNDNPKRKPAALEQRHLRGRAGSPISRATSSALATHVSFDSHRKLLEETDPTTGAPITAFKTIAMRGNAPGRLNPAARFLVVRFGLYPLLHRTVDTLSTGEIRKVLLVRALSQKPRLLLLDNAFDGLDVPSRKVLQDIISKTLKGFTNDLLVQGVSSKDTADSTQVVLMTHRAEELDEIQEMDTVVWWDRDSEHKKNNSNCNPELSLSILRRRNIGSDDIDREGLGHSRDGSRGNDDDSSGWTSGKEVLQRAMGLEWLPSVVNATNSESNWGDDPRLPDRQSVQCWWTFGESNQGRGDGKTIDVTADNQTAKEDILVAANDLTVRRGDATLLKSLSWTVRKGERWIVGGGNGAGKSTLSRLLALSPITTFDNEKDQDSTDNCEEEDPKQLRGGRSPVSSLRILPNYNPDDSRAVVGWVSTESHMQQELDLNDDETLGNPMSIKDFLISKSRNASWENTILPVLDWLGIVDHHGFENSRKCGVDFPITFLSMEQPFRQLSQGEQKMIMIAAALALRPPLLVLDEPCQGLDLIHRERMLRVVEGICRSTNMALIYITHHFEEELLPSISNALHLKERHAVYKGPISSYCPNDYVDDNE